ncbi:MAG: hypothetical protein ACREQJ_02840, partial [Candidatus Binatia bacterium]
MRGRRRERIVGAVVVALAVWVAACYYRKYDPLVRTHVDLALAMAEKRVDFADRGLSPPNSAEFTYPLERAHDFARIVRDRFGERESYRELGRFLESYEKLLGRV